VAALTLARAGVRVTLLDAAERTPFAIGEGLPPAARPILASLGLEARIAAQGHRQALANRSTWGSDRIEITDFMLHPFGPGWHLDRHAFDAGLLEAACEAGAALVRGTFRESVRERGGWLIRVATDAGSRTIDADVVIDCTGRRCAFARRQGARRTQSDRLVACAALLRSTTPGTDPDATTLIEAERDGWWYTAPLPGASRIVMFFTDSDLPASREIRVSGAFRARLEQTRHVGPLCAGSSYEIATPLRVVASDTGRLDRCCGDGWLVAGDAAASFDPISSQGIMTAMQCGRDAATSILEGDEAGYAIRVDELCARYESTRAFVYAKERRWPLALFWSRRQQAQKLIEDQVDRARLAWRKQQSDEARTRIGVEKVGPAGQVYCGDPLGMDGRVVHVHDQSLVRVNDHIQRSRADGQVDHRRIRAGDGLGDEALSARRE
jgi:flavin-dependent dehydrogenase